jgi:hypothetical protein
VNPGETEVCDGVDNNCADGIDEGLLTTFFLDDDDDGYGDPATSTDECVAPPDHVTDNTDCDDGDGAINPAAAEVCDGADNNCVGGVDEGLLLLYYQDLDEDGFGGAAVWVCAATPDLVDVAGDCNDNDDSINPDGTEICDVRDNDCDGAVDEGFAKTTWYPDFDGDGYGNPLSPFFTCITPAGHVQNSGDCNDSSGAIRPGAQEVCDGIDNDCDAQVDEGQTLYTFYLDQDRDGFGDPGQGTQACMQPSGHVDNSDDCRDDNRAIHPNATERCNGMDDDCDQQVDEGVKRTFYRDADGDGHGTASPTLQACTAPSGYASSSLDCNDNDAAVRPGAPEICDSVDQDCDGDVDEGVKSTFYRDLDGDLFGTAEETVEACTLPAGFADNGQDCADDDGAVFPGATEICDQRDNNCNGQVDEGQETLFYPDGDGDGFGAGGPTLWACEAPPGHAGQGSDCDDNNAMTHPGANEICDAKDNNCDGAVDEGIMEVFYRDQDGDGFGREAISQRACAAPEGYVPAAGDCDDTDAFTSPSAEEVCDGLDNNCDGEADEGLFVTQYRDVDGDGFGLADETREACGNLSGYALILGDCDDADANANPDATEVCDGADNNCDGEVDEGVEVTVYRDQDGDGFGDDNTARQSCTLLSGHVEVAGDCDDGAPEIFPGSEEICDDLDNDCDGVPDNAPQCQGPSGGSGNTQGGDADPDPESPLGCACSGSRASISGADGFFALAFGLWVRRRRR